MDIVLSTLLLVLFLLIIVNLEIYKKKVKKYRSFIISGITIIIIGLCVLFYFGKKRERFNLNRKLNNQAGGLSKRDILKIRCGLPINQDFTDHCFADGTHQTCCLLGPVARKESHLSGNPIGEPSKRAYSLRNPNKKITDKTLTPWCTCSGSTVCSSYAKKYKDGTKVAFVNDLYSKKIKLADNPPAECEPYFRDRFKIVPHLTPGVKSLVSNKDLKKKCEKYIK